MSQYTYALCVIIHLAVGTLDAIYYVLATMLSNLKGHYMTLFEEYCKDILDNKECSELTKIRLLSDQYYYKVWVQDNHPDRVEELYDDTQSPPPRGGVKLTK